MATDPQRPAPDAALTERSARVVAYAKLHRAAARRKAGEFLVEGFNAVDAALTSGSPTDVLVTDDAAIRYRDLADRAVHAGIAVSSISERAAQKLSDTVTPTGLFAVCPLLSAPQQLSSDLRLVVVAVDMNEPGNAGTLIRTADAMGVDAVVLAGDSVDPHNGKCVRASAGSVFHLPIVRLRDIDAALTELRNVGLSTVATTADAEVSLDDADEILADPTAWLFGNEAHGLPKEVVAQADYRIAIPMRGKAESLNLSSAASMCLYVSARVNRSK